MEVNLECADTGEGCCVEVDVEGTVQDLREEAQRALSPDDEFARATLYRTCEDGSRERLADDTLTLAASGLCSGDKVYVEIETTGWISPSSYPARVWASAGDACGAWAAYGCRGVGLINLETGAQMSFDISTGVKCRCLALTETHVVFSDTTDLSFVERSSGKTVTRLPCEAKMITAMPSRDSVLVGTATYIKTYTSAGELLRTLDCDGSSFAVNPCGTVLFQNAGPKAVLMDAVSGELLREMNFSSERAFNVKPQFSPNSSLLLCGTVSDRRVIHIGDTFSGELICAVRSHERPLQTACFSACSRFVFTGNQSIYQWDAYSGACLSKFPASIDGDAPFLAVSADGANLLAIVFVNVSVIKIPTEYHDVGQLAEESTLGDRLQTAERLRRSIQTRGAVEDPEGGKCACACVCS